ncbi:Cof-type HAD-IIB family hydrolase [Latilactobacillus curvatus]|uniref:Cof-type HAD-IIB family hydrolase n=1 Tax=Latilactobacillus curvatus TaxID=28038 RepID=UPI003CF100A8
MTIKLVAIDIDDTLLSSQHQLLASTKQQVAKALEQGVKVVLCSGRPLAGVVPFLNQLGIAGDNQYVITFNGSIIETASGKILKEAGISRETYQAIDDYSQATGLPYNVLDQNSVIYTSNVNVAPMTVVQAWENEAGIHIRKPNEIDAATRMVKAVFTGTSEQLDVHEPQVHAQFGTDNYVVRAADLFLEVMHADVNKGKAVQYLANKLGFAPDEIMAIGDEKNDIPMFQFAGTAVAMGNGSAEAKAHVDFITADNDSDGIAQAFDQFIFKV